jgi:hypothetical protein
LSALFQPTRQHIALVSHAVASIVAALTVAALTTVVYARAWRLASVPLRLVLPPWALLLRELITGQDITALRRSVVPTATIIMPPTTDAYPRHNGVVALNGKAASPIAAPPLKGIVIAASTPARWMSTWVTCLPEFGIDLQTKISLLRMIG